VNPAWNSAESQDRARSARSCRRRLRPGRSSGSAWGGRETEAGLSHPPSGLRQGLTQVAGCLAAAAALRANGYGVSYREYDGGHDPAGWRDDLSLALPRALQRA